MPDMNEEQKWSEYLTLFQEVEKRLSNAAWFGEEWEVVTDYMKDGDAPRGVAFRLTKPQWFDGAIHLESWLTNADLKRGMVPVVLHVETNQEKTGLNKNLFVKHLLRDGSSLIEGRDGYIVKEKYAAEPLRRNIAFDKSNLAAQMEPEYAHLQQLAPMIDQAIKEAS